MADYSEEELTVEECVRWIERLERFSIRFEEKGDRDNAKLMDICSMLMGQLALDVECQTATPFPIKTGDC